jgi:hypothetical protein
MNQIKIIYIAFVDSKLGGVEQKILGQFDAIQNNEIDIQLSLYGNSSPSVDFDREIKRRNGVSYFVYQSQSNRFKKRKDRFAIIYENLKNINSANTTLYFRFPASDSASYNFFKKIKERGFKIVTEHQQIENPFRKLNFISGYLMLSALDFVYGKRVRNLIDGFVCVCKDISDFEKSYFNATTTKKFITLGNGITSDNFKTRKDLKFSEGVLEIIFVGAGYRTNGLHRLIQSYFNYSKMPECKPIKVHVVGDSEEMVYNKEMVIRLGLSDSFIFHGYKTAGTYDHLFDKCHIAMGTLSFSRIGLFSASTLKLREYCSRGIPFFYAGDDIDFDENFLFHLKLADNDLPFDFQLVVDFALKMEKIADIPDKMHFFAKQNLDWKNKMKTLTEFISTI